MYLPELTHLYAHVNKIIQVYCFSHNFMTFLVWLLWVLVHDDCAHSFFLQSEEPLTVASLLHSLGLGKYAIIFQAEEVLNIT